MTGLENFKAHNNHTTFGGRIYLSDFDTDSIGKRNSNGSSIAARIASDLKFDEQCRKNITHKEKVKAQE